jgi:cytochrome c553
MKILANLAAATVLTLACPLLQAQGPQPGPADLEAHLAAIQRDPRQYDAAWKLGRKVAAVCANCHGEGGNSIKPNVPNLAGQNPGYLLEQMRQFSDGRRRYEFMEGMIKAMNEDEKIGMVLFYASQQVVPKTAERRELAARGQQIYVSNCFLCHGNDGHGQATIARIAGQQPGYLAARLARYRAPEGARANAQMAQRARMLDPSDIEAVVTYVSTMP